MSLTDKLRLPIPDRCLLEQAVKWLDPSYIQPIPIQDYRALTVREDPVMKTIALVNSDDNLVLEFGRISNAAPALFLALRKEQLIAHGKQTGSIRFR